MSLLKPYGQDLNTGKLYEIRCRFSAVKKYADVGKYRACFLFTLIFSILNIGK